MKTCPAKHPTPGAVESAVYLWISVGFFSPLVEHVDFNKGAKEELTYLLEKMQMLWPNSDGLLPEKLLGLE